MKLVPECDVIKVNKDSKRNTKKRYLATDGVCFICGCIVNYVYEKRCLLCCGSREFLVGEPSKVLRDILGLSIEELKAVCELRGRTIGSGSRAKMTLELFRSIFPKLSRSDNRINEFFIMKIMYRNRKKFRYIMNIESVINNIRRQANKRHNMYMPKHIRLVDAKDMADMVDG